VGHGSWEDYYRFNVIGSQMVCQALRDAIPGCRLVYCSTISALKVGTVPDHHNTHYGLSKHRAGTEVSACAEAMDIPLTVISNLLHEVAGSIDDGIPAMCEAIDTYLGLPAPLQDLFAIGNRSDHVSRYSPI